MLKLAVSDKEVAFCQFGEHAQISTCRVRSVTLGDSVWTDKQKERLIAAMPPFNLLFLLRKLSFWILLKEKEPVKLTTP